MRHTSIFSTVATTETIRDLLRLRGAVVSAYVPWDEREQLIRWASNRPAVPAPDVLSTQNTERFRLFAPTTHLDDDQIHQAQDQVLTVLQADALDPQPYAPAQGDAGCVRRRSFAVFATPDAAQIVPIPFPVEFTISLGETPHLSPLLRVFGPEYAVGLRLTDCAAYLTTTFPSAHASAPDLSTTYTLRVDADPPMASSQAASLSSMRPLIQWLREVDNEMGAFLPRRDQPVVLLGEPCLCDAFVTLNLHRTLLRISNVNGDSSGGTSRRAQVEYIRQRAATFRSNQAEADLRVLRHMHAYRPERFCTDDHSIAEEAASRRIETLFVDEHLLCQKKRTHARSPLEADASGDGAMTDPAPAVSVNPQTGLLPRINRTVAETIVAGGSVHAVRGTNLPLGHHIAAIFRY